MVAAPLRARWNKRSRIMSVMTTIALFGCGAVLIVATIVAIATR